MWIGIRDAMWIDIVVLQRYIIVWRVESRHLRRPVSEMCDVKEVAAGDERADM